LRHDIAAKRNRAESFDVIRVTLRLKSFVFAFLVAALGGATMLAWHQYQELVVLRANLLSGNDRTALEDRLAKLKRRNYDLEIQLAALHAGKAADVAANADPKAANATDGVADTADATLLADITGLTGGGGSKHDNDLELLAAMADMPEFQRLLALQQRGKIDAKYAALFKKLKLTPDELSRLQTLLTDKQSAFADAMIAAKDQGLSGKDARDMAGAVARATQKDIDGSIKAMLGPQRYGQYQNYEKTMPQRETVDQLAQRLSYTNTPLSPRQQDQLIQTLATSKPVPAANTTTVNAAGVLVRPAPVSTMVTPLPGTLSGMGISSSTSVVISPVAVANAQKFLNSQQVGALQQMQQEQVAQQTLSNLLRTSTPSPKVKIVKPGKG
jgi:hypothetical protein